MYPDTYSRTPRSNYVYGSAVPSQTQQEGLDFEVIRGTRSGAVTQTLNRKTIKACIAIAVALVLIACVCLVRVQLMVASQDQCIAANELSAQIDVTRKSANELEVQQSYMSNTTHIRTAATQLNMQAPASVTTLTLAADAVAVDAAGNLSLAGTLSALAQ